MIAPYLMRDTSTIADSSVDYDAWFGEKRPGSAVCEKAIKGIKAWMKEAYHGHCAIRSTPAGTGMSLLQQSLPKDFRYEVLPEGVSKLIHSYSFPHRWQDFSADQGVDYDIRTAFIACCNAVPVYNRENAIFDEKDEFAGYTPARYCVAVTVPDGWSHIGLVPKRPDQGVKHWLYPNKPGEFFTAWVDNVEVALLKTHGWPFTIKHRMIFADRPQPLRAWIHPIIQILEKIERHPRRGDEDIKLIRTGIRAIALQTIGRFHAQGDQERAVIRNGRMTIEQTPELNAWAARFYHPEWSAAIWSAARVKITKIALQFPASEILSIHGDGIRFKSDPMLADTGRVGAIRKK